MSREYILRMGLRTARITPGDEPTKNKYSRHRLTPMNSVCRESIVRAKTNRRSIYLLPEYYLGKKKTIPRSFSIVFKTNFKMRFYQIH